MLAVIAHSFETSPCHPGRSDLHCSFGQLALPPGLRIRRCGIPVDYDLDGFTTYNASQQASPHESEGRARAEDSIEMLQAIEAPVGDAEDCKRSPRLLILRLLFSTWASSRHFTPRTRPPAVVDGSVDTNPTDERLNGTSIDTFAAANAVYSTDTQ